MTEEGRALFKVSAALTGILLVFVIGTVSNCGKSDMQPSKTFRICTAYESGFGHGAADDKQPNPYLAGTEEHEAYQIGLEAGDIGATDRAESMCDPWGIDVRRTDGRRETGFFFSQGDAEVAKKLVETTGGVVLKIYKLNRQED